MNLETNINGQLDFLSSKVRKTDKLEILSEKQLNEVLKNKLRETKLSITNLSIRKEKGEYNLFWNFSGRNYNEFFNADNYIDALEKAIKTIENILNNIYETIPSISNRKQRRQFLKKSKYFSNKKRLAYKELGDLFLHNYKSGLKSADKFLTDNIKTNVSFIIYRELKYRETLVNKTKEEIEKLVEQWYNTVIKEKSFLSDK